MGERDQTCEDDELGGDPPCWAHLVEDEADQIEPAADPAGCTPVDLAGLAQQQGTGAVAWSCESADLDVNLLVFASREGVPEHVNAEVDVLFVGIAGEGAVSVDGRSNALGPGQAILVPNGARRSTCAESDRFAYLTCHRRRAGLLPTPKSSPR